MVRLVCLIFSALVVLIDSASAQYVVRGTVVDADTGAPLPSANIYVEGTYEGTITNADGQFELRVGDVPATLVFRYIGYESQRLSLDAAPATPRHIRMQSVSYRMAEVVVTDENPAIGIMQCVIDRKQAWRSALQSYEAEAYTRFTISNDTGIVSITESLSDVYWDREMGTREVVTSQRVTSNMALSTYLPAAKFVANLYDDNIEMAGYNFIGVTHPRALDAYRFALSGTRLMDSRLVYDIEVEPKHRLKTGFRGSIAVLADECALLEVTLTPGEAFLFPPPIDRLDVTFHQQFSTFGGTAWLPADFRSEIRLEISFGFLVRFPTFRIRQVSRLTDYVVNTSVPDSLYEIEEYVTVNEAAVEADTLLDREGYAVPLDTLERVAYRTIDSTMTLDTAFAPRGAIARVVDADESDDEESQDESLLGRANLMPRLRFNRVEGFHGGLQTRHEMGRLHLGAGFGWSSELESDQWSYQIDAGGRLGEDDRVLLRAEFSHDVVPRSRSAHYPLAVVSVYGLVRGTDYYDYYRADRLEAGIDYAWSSVRVSIGGRYEEASSLETATGFDLVGRSEEPRMNPAVTEGSLRSTFAEIELGDRDQVLGVMGRRRGYVFVEHGTARMGAFTQWAATVDWRFDTLFRRRMIPNALDLRLTAGTHWGDLPVQRLGSIDGSLGMYRPFGVLRTLTGRPYDGDRYVGVFWEHSFRTVPFELLGLRHLARQGYGFILSGAHARTWLSEVPADTSPYLVPAGIHHEIGAALTGIFGLLRIDVTTRLDTPATTVGVSAARLF